MVNNTAKLGGTASDVVVAKIGHGLMMMTWRPTPVPDEECFEAIKAGIDALPPGTKMMLNSGEFYGLNPREANLELIARFFEKYPTYADRAFLSVKGGTEADTLVPNGSPENLRRSVDCILSKLRGTKKLDLFEPARVDSKHQVEDIVKSLADLVKEGKFDYIGLSECKAETVSRAHKVAPIAVVEIEVSPWSYEEETKKVLATCQELGIAVAAYSPLGRGFLTGQIKKPEDLEEGDVRRGMSRFSEENMKNNFAIVDSLIAIADKKKVTAAQLSLAWVASLGPKVIPIPGSSNKKRTLENLAGGDVHLSEEDLNEINGVIEKAVIKGGRYRDDIPNHVLHLWG